MRIFLLIVLSTALATCNEEKQQRPMTQQEIDQRLLEMNKAWTDRESREIRAYITEKEWPVDSTGTGLRYWIYESVEGESAKPGETVEVSFTVELLDGKECYKTEEGETKQFRVEQSDVESGLHEAVQYLSPGDKAKIILPSHLAYGLAGDMNKIPLKSTLVYDLTLHSIQ